MGNKKHAQFVAQAAWSTVLFDQMPKPFAIGISGPTRAGKTTLSQGLCRRFCGFGVVQEHGRTRSKVKRFIGIDGTRVGIMCQDSYFIGTPANCDVPEALDHNTIYKVLSQEVNDKSLDCIIFEGFKAFHDQRVPTLLNLLIWLEVPKEVSRNSRMKNKKCSLDEFNDQIWYNHLRYAECVLPLYNSRLHRIHHNGKMHPQTVLDAAEVMVTKQSSKMKVAVEAVAAVDGLTRLGQWGLPGVHLWVLLESVPIIKLDGSGTSCVFEDVAWLLQEAIGNHDSKAKACMTYFKPDELPETRLVATKCMEIDGFIKEDICMVGQAGQGTLVLAVGVCTKSCMLALLIAIALRNPTRLKNLYLEIHRLGVIAWKALVSTTPSFCI